MIKKVLVVLLTGGMLFGMSGCSDDNKNVDLLINNAFTNTENKEELSENWLMSSIVVQDYFSRKNLEIQSLIINNTYTEDRQSTAYVHIVAENDIARLSINCAIESTKYDNDNWEVTDIHAEEKAIYFPVSEPDIDISFDDSEVIIERTDKEDTGDSIRCEVYYTRVYDGDVACIKEHFYRTYYFDKETGEGWVYYDGLRDECLGGDCELKTITMTSEKNGEGKGNVYVEFTLDNNSITIHDLQAKAQSKKISLLKYYDYSNMGFSTEYYKGISGRHVSSPCENDYICQFELYYKNGAGMDSEATGTLFITPDELWLRILVPSLGDEKYNLISKN